MDVSPAKRSYFTCANVWWKLLFHSTFFISFLFFVFLFVKYHSANRTCRNDQDIQTGRIVYYHLFYGTLSVRCRCKICSGAVTLAFAMLKDTCLVSVVPVAFQLLPSYCCCAKQLSAYNPHSVPVQKTQYMVRRSRHLY